MFIILVQFNCFPTLYVISKVNVQKHTFGRPSLHHVEVRIGKVDMSGSSKAVHVGLRNSLVGYYDHGA